MSTAPTVDAVQAVLGGLGRSLEADVAARRATLADIIARLEALHPHVECQAELARSWHDQAATIPSASCFRACPTDWE